MAKRVILAVAGAGKTYHICHKIDFTKRNLILAFTHENIYNIQKELSDAYGYVPELTTVMTFDSFVYHHLVLPYEPSIASHFGISNFISRGICTVDPPQKCIPKTTVSNPYYVKKNQLFHYVTRNYQYYCATLSELVLQVKQKNCNLIKRASHRLNMFFDCVLIDEFQDFREYDYKLIVALAQNLNNIVLVGDYYQHSVSGRNNSGKPFKKGRVDISYTEFITALRNANFEVDLTTLDKSRRCSIETCEFVSKKLGINITSCNFNKGSIIWITNNVSEILENDHILKLVYKDSASYTFRAMNWSYSKGDTVDEACVILTDKFENLNEGSFSVSKIPIPTINKLYVALTRSRGNLYIIKQSMFKVVKSAYIKL